MAHNVSSDHPWVKAACVPSRQRACERAIETPTASLPPSFPFHQLISDCTLAQMENICATAVTLAFKRTGASSGLAETRKLCEQGRRALKMLADDGAGLAETPNTFRQIGRASCRERVF